MGCVSSLSFNKKIMEREKKKNNFKVDKQTLFEIRWSKLTSTITSYIDSIYPWYDVITMSLYLCDRPQNILPQSDHEKNIRYISIKGHSTKCMTSAVQNSQGQKKQVWEACNQEESKALWLLNIMWYPVWDPRTGKGIRRKLRKSEYRRDLLSDDITILVNLLWQMYYINIRCSK